MKTPQKLSLEDACVNFVKILFLIEDIGMKLENEIGSFRGFVSPYIPVLEYEMIENGKVNPVVPDQRIFERG